MSAHQLRRAHLLKPGKTTTTCSFRWRVGGRRHRRTFITYRPADSVRAHMVTAAATGEAFDLDSGLPLSMRPVVARSWFEHAHAFAAIRPGSASSGFGFGV